MEKLRKVSIKVNAEAVQEQKSTAWDGSTTVTTYVEVDAKQIAMALNDLCNGIYRVDVEAFMEGYDMGHRTVQQLVFGLMMKTIDHVARKADYKIDARNEASRDVARRLMEGFRYATQLWYQEQGFTEEQAKRYAYDGECKPSMFLPLI